MPENNSLQIIKESNCLNCGFPFQGQEVFCPECGQKNTKNALNFKNFMNEIFKGFTSWDAKFWKTLLPLITKPGKVSKDYIEGKRTKYTNPFRFYLTTSVVFFLLLGLTNAIESYQEFTTGKILNKDLDLGIIKTSTKKENDTILNDSIKNTKIAGKDISEFVYFQQKHPNLPINQALDSLKIPKTFTNKFLYNKATTINGFSKDPNRSINELIQQATSHLSTAVFILLPIFALFLKLLYIRRKHTYTYIEHLVFVFHTQTVFFILLIVSNLLSLFFQNIENTIINTLILIFSVYLFIAMKVFYKQEYFKTIVKFLLTIGVYTFLVVLATGVVMVVAFTLM